MAGLGCASTSCKVLPEHRCRTLKAAIALLLCWGGATITARQVTYIQAPENIREGYTEFMSGSLKTLAQSTAQGPFKPMDSKHSPDSPEWDNSFAICAIMKDENITDVTEWLQYYQWLGVDHIFLADNDSEDKSVLSSLSAAFSPSFLTTYTETQPKAQMKVYKWCLETQRSKFNWIAFFDLDEFLVVRKSPSPSPSPPTLKSLMNSYRYKPGLSVHWVFVGPSGLKTRPREGGVLKHYDQCITKVDHRIKTIVNTWFFAGMAEHPHNFLYRGFAHSVLEDFKTVSLSWRPKAPGKSQWNSKRCTRVGKNVRGGRAPPGLVDQCKQWPGAAAPDATANYIALFHYASKSEEDFRAKQIRGSGLSAHTKGEEYLNHLKNNQKHAPMCSELKDIHHLCCGTQPSDDPRILRASNTGATTTTFPAPSTDSSKEQAGIVQDTTPDPPFPDLNIKDEAIMQETAPEVPAVDSSPSVMFRSTHLHSTIIQGSHPSSESLDALLLSVALLTITVTLLAALVLWRGRR